jgi:molecular chaperone GrpE (heat shock protein)
MAFLTPILPFLTPLILAVIVAFLVIQQWYIKKFFSNIEKLHEDLREEIRYSVAPKSIQLSAGVTDFVELAVEVWRIEQRINKSLDTLPENHKKGLDISVQKLKRYLEKYDLQVVDYTNQKYNEGLNLDILSVEKDSSITDPIVKETVEPTVMYKGQVLRKAKIVLLKKDD